MKKQLLRFLCTALLAVTGMSASAQETFGFCGANNEEDISWELNGSQLIFSGTGEIKTYSTDMPTAYPWFALAEDIQGVIIGEGITNIPAWAFAMYENLRSIHLPSTLKTIGWSCLEETNLWNVSLPEGLETIEGYAFMFTPFSTVCIPSTVTEIGERAFGYCENLVSVGSYADVPPALGSNAFGDSPIETVYVKSAKIAAYQAADGWSDFGDKIQSPAGYCGPDGNDEDGDDDVTKATWSFDMATRTLTIEGTKMGQYNRPWESAGMGGQGGGFNPDNNVGYPQGIYHIVIGEGITAIPAMAFYMEVGVTDVVLPSTLESIGMGVFGENFSLQTVTIHAVTPPALGEDIFMDCLDIPTIVVPAAAVEAYKTAWSAFASKIFAEGEAPERPFLTLDETTDNSAAIAAKDGVTCDVTLKRTLRAGSYNTFAVPFDVDADTLTAMGIIAKQLTASTLDGTTLTLSFTDATSLKAGKPYLIKVAADLENPTFQGVTISDDLLGDFTDYTALYPTTGKTTINIASDAVQVLFLGAENTLHPTAMPADIKGFRAYFVVFDQALVGVRSFRLDLGEGETAILAVPATTPSGAWYTIDGRRLNGTAARKGAYIHNGKVIIK